MTAIAEAVYDVALALPDAFHIDVDGSRVNTVANASPREIGDASARDHGFGWRAALIDAGSTHMLTFDQRGAKSGSGERPAQRSAALS